MKITYEKAFGNVRIVATAAAAVASFLPTGCANSSSVSFKSYISKANSACSGSSGENYCACMKNQMSAMISQAQGKGSLTTSQVSSLGASNKQGFDKCMSDASNGADTGPSDWPGWSKLS